MCYGDQWVALLPSYPCSSEVATRWRFYPVAHFVRIVLRMELSPVVITSASP